MNPPGPQLKYIPQQGRADCGVATLAMVAGVTYRQAWRLLPKKARDKVAAGVGVNHVELEVALRKCGFVAFIAVHEHYAGGEKKRSKWPPEPIGWRHVISSRNADDTAHFSAMDCTGRVFDPDDPDHHDIADYHAVDEVTVLVRPTKPFTFGA